MHNFSKSYMVKYFGILIILFLGSTLFSQESTVSKQILLKANQNFILLNENPEKAFLEAKKIEAEARKLKVPKAELKAIDTQCMYHKSKNDFENMMISSESLFQKATFYKINATRATAKRYLFEAAIFSGLPDKALKELEQGMEIAENSTDKNSEEIIRVKADLLITYSNYYSLKNDFKSRLKYIKLSGKEYERLPGGDNKKYLMWLHYSNMAGAYKEVNQLDSAKYFAHLSLTKDNGYENSEVRSMIFSILGDLAMIEKDYETALSYFKKTEKLKGYQNHLNLELLYDNFIYSYQKLQQDDSARLYKAKKDSLKIRITENQNKSLHKLLNEKESKSYAWYFYALFILIIGMGIFTFIIIKKNRTLAQEEKISQQYLKEVPGIPTGNDYSKLIELLKKNDPSFMLYFEELFPEFSSKLLKINSTINPSEIEFCALLKLKIPTNDIARYKYITLKSVQNRKYIIRKRLDIPKGVDIYNWFSSF